VVQGDIENKKPGQSGDCRVWFHRGAVNLFEGMVISKPVESFGQ